ncbi:MAG: dihydroorotase [Clostridiales bacterium]|jgi:dihydroorotase|nr:dihydroorotase [Clostridiales bacterium]
MRLLIKNASVFDESGSLDISDIFIDYGEIVEIGPKLNYDIPEYIDAKGKYVFPGLIDVSCKICDPGFEYKEDIATVSKSAIKGGFTTLTASPDTNPVIDDKTVVKYIDNKAKNLSYVNIYQYGGMTKGLNGTQMSEVGQMKQAGVVAISDGGKADYDASLLSNVLKYSTMFDIPVITFCEDKSISGAGVMNKGIISTEVGLRGIPRESEEVVVARNLLLAKYAGARIHITNISTKGSVWLIREAKKNGVKATCDTCPHYFTLTEEDLRGYGTFFKVKPPLRTKEDVEAVIEGIFDGTIDMVSSGHSPETIERKMTDFENAAYGISSLETAFLVSYNCLVLERGMGIMDFLKKLTVNPAKFLNLPEKGGLQVGMSADMFIFDAHAENKIDPSTFASKAKFSPYSGKTVKGKVLGTIVQGRIMYLQEF